MLISVYTSQLIIFTEEYTPLEIVWENQALCEHGQKDKTIKQKRNARKVEVWEKVGGGEYEDGWEEIRERTVKVSVRAREGW